MSVWVVSHHWGFDGGSCVVQVFAFESLANEWVESQECRESSWYEVEEHAVLAM